ncbi:MAG: HNH endonuclease, partial [Candidatus Cloacimonadaceae bacterium]|nr:HNH endonuclease [Candidatus Cloacimonadaceae bacterium]
MAIMLKRQLNDDEKKEILTRHGRKCYVNGHDIPEGDSVHFDHIFAFAKGGPTELNNIAPMCEHHNKSKGTLALEDYRNKLELGEFFNQGDKQTLTHFLQFCKNKAIIENYGMPITIIINDKSV